MKKTALFLVFAVAMMFSVSAMAEDTAAPAAAAPVKAQKKVVKKAAKKSAKKEVKKEAVPATESSSK